MEMYNGNAVQHTLYAIFANGAYWGTWDAENAEQALRDAAGEVGTDGVTEGLEAFEITAQEHKEVEEWWEDGADAATTPACVEH
ncbi:hypothetical protein [Salinicola endophyticus]|uniref:Uncharacterized protein n=1 Tax=Salinicola endophyticus TaxID=1949083 RepID=A0AB74UI17_9GAMM